MDGPRRDPARLRGLSAMRSAGILAPAPCAPGHPLRPNDFLTVVVDTNYTEVTDEVSMPACA